MTRTGLQMLWQSVPDVSAAKFNHTGAIGADPYRRPFNITAIFSIVFSAVSI